MVTPSSKSPPTGYPEYAVRRETICRYFEPPLPRSTFHDFVNKGVIIPMKGIRGFYLLNASLRRLGLREVPRLPEEPATRSLEEIVRLAFSLIDPLLFPPPSWLLTVEELDLKDADHARLLADQHREVVNALDGAELKIAYLGGVLDAQVMLSEGLKSGLERVGMARRPDVPESRAAPALKLPDRPGVIGAISVEMILSTLSDLERFVSSSVARIADPW